MCASCVLQYSTAIVVGGGTEAATAAPSIRRGMATTGLTGCDGVVSDSLPIC